MPNQKYELNSPDVITEDFDDDLVLLNLRSGEYFNFTGKSRIFLDALIEGADVDELLTTLTQQDSATGSSAADLFENIKNHNLVRPVVGAVVAGLGALKAQAVMASSSTFYFECFTDLGDLIAADPIHDVVPEAGWPIMPESK